MTTSSSSGGSRSATHCAAASRARRGSPAVSSARAGWIQGGEQGCLRRHPRSTVPHRRLAEEGSVHDIRRKDRALAS